MVHYTQNNSINYISCINMSKIILGSNDEVYNILTKNWFGQAWAGMEIDIIWAIG